MTDKMSTMHMLILSGEAHDIQSDRLLRWMAKGHCSRQPGNILHRLCDVLGLPATCGYPLAALTTSAASPACLGRLEPVHLHLQRDFFSLGSLPILQPHETSDLLTAFNAHFADRGLLFSASSEPQVWHVAFSQAKDLQASPTHGLIGQDIRPWLPTGVNASWWRQLLNEIQMLLFEHPVNLVREASGLDVVNSVWLSGIGVYPASWSSPISNLYANDALSRGLAQSGNIGLHALDDVFADLSKKSVSSRVLVLESGQELTHKWLPWLCRILLRRTISELHIHCQSGSDVLTLQMDMLSLWKFWRRAPKSQLIESNAYPKAFL